MLFVSAGKAVYVYALSRSAELVVWVKRAVIADVYEASPALAASLQTQKQERALWKHVVK